MEGKILIAFAFCIETWKTLSGYDIAFEAADLSFVEQLFAVRVLVCRSKLLPLALLGLGIEI
jgi:hypothetical protein